MPATPTKPIYLFEAIAAGGLVYITKHYRDLNHPALRGNVEAIRRANLYRRTKGQPENSYRITKFEAAGEVDIP